MSRHLMAKMRNHYVAKHFEEEPDLPHSDWVTKPNYRNPDTRTDLTPNMKAQVYHEWHPPYGESHIQYWVTPIQKTDGSGDHSGRWGATHHGLCRGRKTMGPDKNGDTLTHDDYDWEDHENLGTFDTAEEGMAAAHAYHEQRYGGDHKPSADYYDDILKKIDEPEDGYDIFGDRP